MSRCFNDKGVCIPEKHYMADISGKVKRIVQMIDNSDYFVINRPRQYGKTTVLYMLDRYLKSSDGYFPIKISFEGMGSDCYKSEAAFIEAFILQLKMLFGMTANREMLDYIENTLQPDTIPKLGLWFTDLVLKTGEKVVLMIDEVDKSCNNQLFLDFLGMLRAKYLKRSEGLDITFQSVVLAGVHDIKTLKAKLRDGEQGKFNSPWNIAADFRIEMSLSPADIVSMLEGYRDERKVKIDIPHFAEKLFYFTSGYPFLVSLLCKVIDEEILPADGRNEWKSGYLVKALQMVLLRDNTNFESLIKNLENNPELYEFVFKIIMNGMDFSFNPRNSVIHLGRVYGVLKEEERKVR
ncbi:MAG: AAA family ATPase, partial [bacterium]|nr:AAA family ATPase [bacterium]